jgi:Arc/MetJ-type ribon-helix-helix transcriptional regulator
MNSMSLESRSRMISFRLTAEEYDRFRELCFSHGIRSVSEMARAAINMLLEQPERAPQEALESRVSELEGRIHLLSLELKRLNQSTSPGASHSASLQMVTSAQGS